ncbi:hypothetical protein LTR66_001414 [Elasticomyces elasticus]|nr:hypothetical protein LTR28_011249 [Elasticomyces elasticus]KAK4999583.1 hypothetical protein LTR66_001414 [Elasticomyces elasticus]
MSQFRGQQQQRPGAQAGGYGQRSPQGAGSRDYNNQPQQGYGVEPQANGEDPYGQMGAGEEGEQGEEDQMGEEQYGEEEGGQDEQEAPAPRGKPNNAMTSKTKGPKGTVGSPKGAPKHSKFPQDPHHSKLMAHYHEITETGMTEDHLHSIVHVGSLFLAHLARSAGMTHGHHADHEAAKAAHQNGASD